MNLDGNATHVCVGDTTIRLYLNVSSLCLVVCILDTCENVYPERVNG